MSAVNEKDLQHDDNFGTDDPPWDPPKVAGDPLRVFIGFDPRQVVSYSALAVSIIEHSSKPVAITPLCIQTLPITRMGLTPFTYTRFLVPWLMGFKGTALFLDSDMLVRADIAELFALADSSHALSIVKDEQRFEWASVMLFNCGHPDNAVLTPEYIEDPEQCKAPHIIDWTEKIGALPSEWNHLVGYDQPRDDAKLVHYTMGVPAWPETIGCEYAKDWIRTVTIVNFPWTPVEVKNQIKWADLMGNSVHAKTLPDGRRVPLFYEPPPEPFAEPPAPEEVARAESREAEQPASS